MMHWTNSIHYRLSGINHSFTKTNTKQSWWKLVRGTVNMVVLYYAICNSSEACALVLLQKIGKQDCPCLCRCMVVLFWCFFMNEVKLQLNNLRNANLQDHKFDVVTNVVGLVAAVLGDKYYWWIDPIGAIMLAIYTITNWSRTVMENAGISLSVFWTDKF